MRARFDYEHVMITGSNFKDDVAKIGVYFETMNTKLTYEEAKYKVDNF